MKTFKEFLNEGLKYKKDFFDVFLVYNFTDNNKFIGRCSVKLKKNWNQFHIEVEQQFQRQGYSVQMMNQVIDDLNFISIPDGRIINDNIYKIIEKFKLDKKFEVFRTDYEETIISNKKKTKKEILKFFA